MFTLFGFIVPKLILACLMLNRNRFKECVVILKSLTEIEPTNLLFNTLLNFVYAKCLGEEKLGEKFKRITERIYLRKTG